jgi:hypothetical protein
MGPDEVALVEDGLAATLASAAGGAAGVNGLGGCGRLGPMDPVAGVLAGPSAARAAKGGLVTGAVRLSGDCTVGAAVGPRGDTFGLAALADPRGVAAAEGWSVLVSSVEEFPGKCSMIDMRRALLSCACPAASAIGLVAVEVGPDGTLRFTPSRALRPVAAGGSLCGVAGVELLAGLAAGEGSGGMLGAEAVLVGEDVGAAGVLMNGAVLAADAAPCCMRLSFHAGIDAFASVLPAGPAELVASGAVAVVEEMAAEGAVASELAGAAFAATLGAVEVAVALPLADACATCARRCSQLGPDALDWLVLGCCGVAVVVTTGGADGAGSLWAGVGVDAGAGAGPAAAFAALAPCGWCTLMRVSFQAGTAAADAAAVVVVDVAAAVAEMGGGAGLCVRSA